MKWPDKVIKWLFLNFVNESQHSKTNKMTCASSEDSYQPGHPPSLIRVFAVHMKKGWILSYSQSTQQRLWCGCPIWSESSLGAHVILLVLLCGGSNTREIGSQTMEMDTFWFCFDRLTIDRLLTYFPVLSLNIFWCWQIYQPVSPCYHCLEITTLLLVDNNIWAASWQNQQNGIYPVWSVFAVRMKKAWVLSYPLSAQRRLIRLGGCPGWSQSSLEADLSLLWAQSHFVGFVMRWLISDL